MQHTLPAVSLRALALAAAALCGSAHATETWVATHTLKHDVGAAVEGKSLQPGDAIRIAVTLRLRNQADMDALTASLLAGKTSSHLSRAEFLSHYAPTESQVKAVVDHLSQAGFTSIRVAPNRMLISAKGTAATVKAGFNTELRHFDVDGRAAFANVGDAQVPAHLGGIVGSVQGLQNVHRFQSALVLADATTAAGTKVGHNPTDFPSIYDANGLATATNATIGIIAEGDISQTLSDLNDFTAGAGYPTANVQTLLAGDPSSDTSGLLEWNLDSQSSLSAAGGEVGKMVFYVATSMENDAITAAFNQAVSDNVAQVVNVSLGECETGALSSGMTAADDAIFQIAIAQGQVFSVSSGDRGSYTCGSKRGGQSYPAVSPYVIAVGGTSLSTTGQTTWAGETLWSCKSQLTCLLLGGEGGGASKTEAAPSWQLSSGVLGTSTQRGMPDISFDADPATGAMVLNGGKLTQVGGTSLAAPLFSGFWARIQSVHGNTLVYPAAALYQYGPTNGPKMFHDVKTGSNGGYSAAVGWDAASGFGSLDVGKFNTFIDGHPGF